MQQKQENAKRGNTSTHGNFKGQNKESGRRKQVVVVQANTQ